VIAYEFEVMYVPCNILGIANMIQVITCELEIQHFCNILGIANTIRLTNSHFA